MTIPLKNWRRGSKVYAADLNRMVEAIKRATPVAGNGIRVSQSLGGSVISLAGKAGGGGGAIADGVDYPFRIRRVNSGTADNPAWHTLVHVPDKAFSCRFPLYKDMSQYDADNWPDWYEFTHNDGIGLVCLQVKVIRHEAWESQTVRCYYKIGPNQEPPNDWPTREYPVNYRWHVIPIGVVTADGSVYNLARSEIYVNADFILDSPGGGGSMILVDDKRTDREKSGVMGYGGLTAWGVAVLIAKDGLGVTNVVMDAGMNPPASSLVRYLTGALDCTGEGSEGAGENYRDLGVNVNTTNFPDLCLGEYMTPDEDPIPDKAAPSCHVHTLDQLVNEEEKPVSGDDLVDFFSNAGLWDALGETGPSGEGPSENSILTVGDIEDDASYLKRDAAVPVAGDPSTDLLVLSGHRHPLNVADVAMATGPTGEEPQPPPTADYVLPVGVGTTGPSGEADPTAAEFGSQPFYARVDHVHPICADMGPTGTASAATVGPQGGVDKSMRDDSGDVMPTGPSGVVLDGTGWVPGAYGYTESYCCRVAKVSVPMVGEVRYAIFRRRKVSRTGAVLWVGPEYIGFSM